MAGVSHGVPSVLKKLADGVKLAGNDQKQFYQPHNLIKMGSVVAGMGIIANTRIDYKFGNWYQDNIRRNGSDNISKWVEPVGNKPYPFITILTCASINLLPNKIVELPVIHTIAEMGSRSVRIILTGAPPMSLFQRILGSPRPSQGPSTWTPFKTATGMSGHTFLGAVPFLAAYTLTDNIWLRSTAVTLSTFVGISRINDNKHYLSQAIGGWSMAFLAARSLIRTPEKEKAVKLSVALGFVGVSFSF